MPVRRRGSDEAHAAQCRARVTALAATLIDFALGLVLWFGYQTGGPQWQFTETRRLFGRFSWALGIDGIALLLIVLTVFLMPICILASWKAIEKRVPEYMAAFLLTEIADDRRVHGAGPVPVLHLLRRPA